MSSYSIMSLVVVYFQEFHEKQTQTKSMDTTIADQPQSQKTAEDPPV